MSQFKIETKIFIKKSKKNWQKIDKIKTKLEKKLILIIFLSQKTKPLDLKKKRLV